MSATETAEQAALRAKYREERDKRVRPDGNEQYLEPTGRFAHFLDDPYVPRVEREPLFDEVKTVGHILVEARIPQVVTDHCIYHGTSMSYVASGRRSTPSPLDPRMAEE